MNKTFLNLISIFKIAKAKEIYGNTKGFGSMSKHLGNFWHAPLCRRVKSIPDKTFTEMATSIQ